MNNESPSQHHHAGRQWKGSLQRPDIARKLLVQSEWNAHRCIAGRTAPSDAFEDAEGEEETEEASAQR